MRKVIILLLALALSVNVLEAKRRPLHLGHYDHRVYKPYPRRSAMRVPVQVFQDENVLQVEAEDALCFTLCFLDADNNVLSEENLQGSCEHVSIPSDATAVVVYVGDTAFIGMLD